MAALTKSADVRANGQPCSEISSSTARSKAVSAACHSGVPSFSVTVPLLVATSARLMIVSLSKAPSSYPPEHRRGGAPPQRTTPESDEVLAGPAGVRSEDTVYERLASANEVACSIQFCRLMIAAFLPGISSALAKVASSDAAI